MPAPPINSKHVAWLTAALALGCVNVLFGFARADTLPPDQMVRTTATETLATIRQQGEAFSQNPTPLYQLIEERLVPHFDVNLISRQVLGQHWSRANPEQRTRFSAAFRRMLVRTYAKALLAFREDALEWQPVNLAPGATEALVKSTITRAGAPPLVISYKMHLEASRWLVYDVTIDGVSFVTNYRGIFNSEIRRNSLDAIIKRMEDKNAEAG